MIRYLVTACLLLCSHSLFAANTAEQFSEIWRAEWQWRLEQQPQFATSIGVHDYDDKLGDVSHSVQAKRAKYWRAVLGKLDELNATQLTTAQNIDLRIYRAQIDSFIANIELGSIEMPLNSDSSFYSDLAMLPRYHPFRNAEDVRNYLARLRAVPSYLDQHTELLRAGLKSGRTLPRVVLQGRDAPIAAVAELTDPELSGFYAPLRTLPSTISANQAADFQAQARAAIIEAVIPAHKKLLRFMREHYIPGARESLAASVDSSYQEVP